MKIKIPNLLIIVSIGIAYVTAGDVYKVNVNSSLNIRKSESTSSESVGSLKNGQFIYVTSVSNEWAKFYKGYVNTKYLIKTTSGTNYITTAKVNFRSGPSTNYDIITTENTGTKIIYFDKDPFYTSWSVTNLGYVNSEYIEKQGNQICTVEYEKEDIKDKEGICKNINDCTGEYRPVSGKCKGETNIQCCIKRDIIEGKTKEEIMANLKNKLNFIDYKKEAMIEAAEQMLDKGYDPKFIAGMLGNIQNEGTPGMLESSSYKSKPIKCYLQCMNDNFEYLNKYSSKSITELGINEIKELSDNVAKKKEGLKLYFNSTEPTYKYDYCLQDGNEKKKGDPCSPAFGFGMIQWTDHHRRNNTLNEYKYYMEHNFKNYGKLDNYPSVEQSARIEVNAMLLELERDIENPSFNKIYDNWLKESNNSPYSAGYVISKKYEKPASENEHQIRGENAENIYNLMTNNSAQKCNYDKLEGICMNEDICDKSTNVIKPGLCKNFPVNIKCCLPKNPCDNNYPGVCIPRDLCDLTNNEIKDNKCMNYGNNIKCCSPKSSTNLQIPGKTNSGLIKYAKAQLGKPYWFGTYGQIGSQSLYEDKRKQYPDYYTANDFQDQIKLNVKVHDCSGLIKGYLWSNSIDDPNPKHNSTQDLTASMMYSKSSEKGDSSSFKKIKGQLIYKVNTENTIIHVGIYIGNNKVIEAKRHADGVIESDYDNSWIYWSQCPFIYNDNDNECVCSQSISSNINTADNDNETCNCDNNDSDSSTSNNAPDNSNTDNITISDNNLNTSGFENIKYLSLHNSLITLMLISILYIYFQH